MFYYVKLCVVFMFVFFSFLSFTLIKETVLIVQFLHLFLDLRKNICTNVNIHYNSNIIKHLKVKSSCLDVYFSDSIESSKHIDIFTNVIKGRA